MPIQINEENGDRICDVRVSGELVSEDYEGLSAKFERLVTQNGKLRVLFDMSDFHGWDTGALWEEGKFDIKHFSYFNEIERCACIGDQRWQRWLTEFCEPFTKATIRYFDRADAAEARKWLGDSFDESDAPQRKAEVPPKSSTLMQKPTSL